MTWDRSSPEGEHRATRVDPRWDTGRAELRQEAGCRGQQHSGQQGEAGQPPGTSWHTEPTNLRAELRLENLCYLVTKE